MGRYTIEMITRVRACVVTRDSLQDRSAPQGRGAGARTAHNSQNMITGEDEGGKVCRGAF